jgi:lysophospholipase L1-like esterase
MNYLTLLLVSLFILGIISIVLKYNFITRSTIPIFESFVTKQNQNQNQNQNKPRKNIVLLGDSILNNSVYTLPKSSVPSLISQQLEKSPEKTLYNLAKDGATINDCVNQLDAFPFELNNNETSVFISVGGNDILNGRRTETEKIDKLFTKYMDFIKSVKKSLNKTNIVLLKLYYPVKPSYKIYYPAVKQWNQLLVNNSSTFGYRLLETDKLVVLEEDIVYDIEPSAKGGKKIADAIVSFI